MKYRLALAPVAALALAVIAGCGSTPDPSPTSSGSPEVNPGRAVVYWTTFNTPERLAKLERVRDEFKQTTGIDVEIVGLTAADINQAIVSGAAAGDLPDVVGADMNQVALWRAQDLLNVDAVQEVIGELGESTFNASAMRFISYEEGPVAVPTDGWGQMLFYRKDLLAQAGLDAPESLDELVAAAQALNSPERAGIVLGNLPGDGLTNQTLEWLSLANGCELLTRGEATLDSKNCEEVYSTYTKLIEASVAGAQDVTTTREAYLSGRAAMISWSPHLLDEIAGVDPNFPLTCSECVEDPGFLSANTGVVMGLSGPSDPNGQLYGATLNQVILSKDNVKNSQAFVSFLLDEGYESFLSVVPEGRFPMRTGTSQDPEKFVNLWATLPIGADPTNQKTILDAFGDDFLVAVARGATEFSRWGFAEKEGPLVASVVAGGALTPGQEAISAGLPAAEIAAAFQERVAAEVAAAR